MTETPIAHETAWLAKQKGCELIKNIQWLPTKSWAKTNISQALLQRWLRETHYLNIEQRFGSRAWEGFGYYYALIHRGGDGLQTKVNIDESYPFENLTYEQVTELSLVKALKLINNETDSSSK